MGVDGCVSHFLFSSRSTQSHVSIFVRGVVGGEFLASHLAFFLRRSLFFRLLFFLILPYPVSPFPCPSMCFLIFCHSLQEVDVDGRDGLRLASPHPQIAQPITPPQLKLQIAGD